MFIQASFKNDKQLIEIDSIQYGFFLEAGTTFELAIKNYDPYIIFSYGRIVYEFQN